MYGSHGTVPMSLWNVYMNRISINILHMGQSHAPWYAVSVATHCNTLQHTATHCNTLQHTATQSHAPWYAASHQMPFPPPEGGIVGGGRARVAPNSPEAKALYARELKAQVCDTELLANECVSG